MNIPQNYGEGEPKFVASWNESIDYSSDGPTINGAYLASQGLSDDETREAIGLLNGVDPEIITLQGTRKVTSNRTFGFSNWNGSNWQPTGPQSDPSLN